MDRVRGHLDRATKAFKGLFLMQECANTESSWTTHDANLALVSALTQPSSNTPSRPALPLEIVLQILEHPSRCILTSCVSIKYPEEGPFRVRSGRAPLAIVKPLSLAPSEASKVRKVVFEVTGKDQGWSSYSSDHGTYNNTWTWYEAIVRSSKVFEGESFDYEEYRVELHRNRHAGEKPETYRTEFVGEHELLKKIREGGVIHLDACARFDGWECQVHGARVEVWSVDDLSREREMRWFESGDNGIQKTQGVFARGVCE